jgi:hypothetical protein
LFACTSQFPRLAEAPLALGVMPPVERQDGVIDSRGDMMMVMPHSVVIVCGTPGGADVHSWCRRDGGVVRATGPNTRTTRRLVLCRCTPLADMLCARLDMPAMGLLNAWRRWRHIHGEGLRGCDCDERASAARFCAVQGPRSDVWGRLPLYTCLRERAGVPPGLPVPVPE